jgi:hypothetical protein
MDLLMALTDLDSTKKPTSSDKNTTLIPGLLISSMPRKTSKIPPAKCQPHPCISRRLDNAKNISITPDAMNEKLKSAESVTNDSPGLSIDITPVIKKIIPMIKGMYQNLNALPILLIKSLAILSFLK